MAKKTRSLNDTIAVTAIPAFQPEHNETQTKSVRKIDNGFIVSSSSFKDGRYECSEEYSSSPPAPSEGENLMRKAVDYMKREGTL